MSRQTLAMALAFVGILFFLAMAFNIMPANYATFGGIAFCMASGLTWAFYRQRQ
jgi:multidrug transporter EmrE-like cation transporter